MFREWICLSVRAGEFYSAQRSGCLSRNRMTNGVQIPKLALGTWLIKGAAAKDAVKNAIEIGYRHIDTAQAYGNEEEVGNGVRESGIRRDDIFITSKVAAENKSYASALESIDTSLKTAKLDFIDLMLIHSPQPWVEVNQSDNRYFEENKEVWRAMETALKAGKIRAIGISNFYADRMVDFAAFNRIKPMVNQMETHIFNQQKELKKWADKYEIHLEAWGPFGEGRQGIFENPVVGEIAQKYNKTAAQVMLRWNIQRGVIVIPKSAHIERMEENFNVFDFSLTDEDMSKISDLDKKESAFFSHNDPAMVEWFVGMVETRKHTSRSRRCSSKLPITRRNTPSCGSKN